MKIDFFFELETIFERGLVGKNFDHLHCDQLKYLNVLQLLETQNYLQFYVGLERLLLDANTLNEKAFLISWLVIGSEVQFDENRRKTYLARLNQLPSYEFSLYLEYVKIYFESLTYFFDSNLLLSETLISKALSISRNLNYARGEARCLYHKSLIFKETRQHLQFNQTIKSCLEISSQHSFQKTKERALRVSVQEVPSEDPIILELILKIKEAVYTKDSNYLRVLVVQAESRRRALGFGRRRFSFYFYRIQYLFLVGKISYARLLLVNVKDQVLKLEIYQFMLQNRISLLHSENENLKSLRVSLGVADDELNQIRIDNIKNENLKRLLHFLSSSQEANKETIFESVFQIEYDPTIHDIKIYQLVLKAKKEISGDVILNNYGKYALNFAKYKFIS